MKYHIDWIKNRHETGQRDKYIFFWGHQPNRDGSIGKSCFSQWWEGTFEKDGLHFNTAEHWMMYQKALLFEDAEIAQQILVAKTAAEAKKLGRKVRGFKQDVWEANSYEIVLEGNHLKFSQDPALKTFLLNTGQRVLVEASPLDNIWGIGLAQDAPYITNPETWEGLNLLGFAIMEVRDRLRGMG